MGETGQDSRDERRTAHNPEVAGSNPAPATKYAQVRSLIAGRRSGFFLGSSWQHRGSRSLRVRLPATVLAAAAWAGRCRSACAGVRPGPVQRHTHHTIAAPAHERTAGRQELAAAVGRGTGGRAGR
jgi:hypothetical protein